MLVLRYKVRSEHARWQSIISTSSNTQNHGFWLISQDSNFRMLLHTEAPPKGNVLQHMLHEPLEDMDPDLLADQISDQFGAI